MRADNCDFDQLLIRSLRELAALSKHFKRKSNRISCESKNDHDFHQIVEETINFARIVTTSISLVVYFFHPIIVYYTSS